MIAGRLPVEPSSPADESGLVQAFKRRWRPAAARASSARGRTDGWGVAGFGACRGASSLVHLGWRRKLIEIASKNPGRQVHGAFLIVSAVTGLELCLRSEQAVLSTAGFRDCRDLRPGDKADRAVHPSSGRSADRV